MVIQVVPDAQRKSTHQAKLERSAASIQRGVAPVGGEEQASPEVTVARTA